MRRDLARSGLTVQSIIDDNPAYWGLTYRGVPIVPSTEVAPESIDGIVMSNINPAQIDKRTETVCDNVKKDKIRVFTVRVIEGNLDLLRGCASAPNMFYDVQLASQLKDVFTSIAASLSGARLSR